MRMKDCLPSVCSQLGRGRGKRRAINLPQLNIISLKSPRILNEDFKGEDFNDPSLALFSYYLSFELFSYHALGAC
jgi:hypothetical protein